MLMLASYSSDRNRETGSSYACRRASALGRRGYTSLGQVRGWPQPLTFRHVWSASSFQRLKEQTFTCPVPYRRRICPACEEPDSIESVHHVLLHCPAYEHHRATLRSVVTSLPGAHDRFPALSDDEGLIALLRDDFMGGAEEAIIAADAFLHAVITFRNHYVALGLIALPCLTLHDRPACACLPCAFRLLAVLPLQTEEVLSPRNPRRHQLGVASLWGWSMGTLVRGHQA